MTKLLGLLCRLPKSWGGGHVWGKARNDISFSAITREPNRIKSCRRCGEERYIKIRKPRSYEGQEK